MRNTMSQHKEQDLAEYHSRKNDPYWMSPTKLNDYSFANGLFEARWLRGYKMKRSEPMKLGYDLHEILFWFYNSIKKRDKLKDHLVSSVRDGKAYEAVADYRR